MPVKPLQISILLLASALGLSCTHMQPMETKDPELSIQALEDEDLLGSIQVTLENSVFKAVMRSNGPHHKHRYDGPMFWHHIRSLVYKSNGIDQAKGVGIDCNHFRGNCYKTEMLYDGPDKKTIRLYYHSDPRYILEEEDLDSTNLPIVSEYTIFPHSPVIQVRYVSYIQYNEWANAFDIVSPGGLNKRFEATTRVYGQEKYSGELIYHEDAYWQGFLVGNEDHLDDQEGGPLNYHGHFIMAVGNPDNGVGFGRVMPIYKAEKSGGARIFKLLWDQGFELFSSSGTKYPSEQPAYTAYIFIFNKGLEEAIEMGKRIADGELICKE